MGRFLQCPLAMDSDEPRHDSDQLPSFLPSGSSSFSNSSSLSSQSSLPSVPSLSPPVFEHSAACQHCLTTLTGHSSYVFSLALAGKYLYSGASDGEIRLWNRNFCSVGSCVSSNNTVVEGYSGVKSVVVAGDRIFSAHHDHRIRVWKIDHSEAQQKCKLVTILPKLSDSCMSLFSAKNYVKIRRHKSRTWVHHVDAVSALALTADGSLLYSVSWDRTLKIWRTSDYKCLESIQNAHDDAINAVVLSGDGYVYTASADKRIKVWRKTDDGSENKKHALVSMHEKHRSAVNALALSADGSVLYSGACDRSIIVWEKYGEADMAVTGALRGHTKAVLCLATTADLVCSGSADRTVRVWRRSASGSYSMVAVLEGHRNPVKCLTAAVGGGSSKGGDEPVNSYQVYSGGLDFEIRFWEIWVPKPQLGN